MMEYDLFRKLVIQRIKDYLPPVFSSYQVETNPVRKVNETKDAICLFPPGRPANIAVPTLYLDDIYRDFSEDEDLERVLQTMAEVIETWSGYEVPEFGEFRLQDHTDTIVANLISTELNRELLEEVPHRPFLDMTIVYRVIHSINENGINSAMITHKILEQTDLTEDQLYDFAMKNTSRLFPCRRYSGDEKGVFVMTNDASYCGATTMLYQEDMRRLASKIGGDFFILPSSRHEFFAVDVRHMDSMELVQMLAVGNEKITDPVDQLSCAIYRYKAKSGEISRVVGYDRG